MLPLCAVDGRSRNPLYYYKGPCNRGLIKWKQLMIFIYFYWVGSFSSTRKEAPFKMSASFPSYNGDGRDDGGNNDNDGADIKCQFVCLTTMMIIMVTVLIMMMVVINC